MFLRRGRFRGREHDGNDRGGSQRRFERRGSAPASIEHGAAPGVSSAEDGYTTSPRSQAAPPWSSHPTPARWEGEGGVTSKHVQPGVSRIFALSVQELNCRSQVDLMSQYGRGDCVSSGSVKVSGPQSSPVGLTGTGTTAPPECEPPEQPDWGPLFLRQHSHKPAPFAEGNLSGPGDLQRLDNSADCVDRSERSFTGHRELSTRNSQGAPFQAVNDKTRRPRNLHSRQIPLDGKGGSDHPAGSIPRRSALSNQRSEVDDQAPTLKPTIRQRDICQSKQDKNAESSRARSDVSASHQQGYCCDSAGGATVASYLPPIGHRSDRKKKKRHGSRSKKRFGSESGHDTSAENLGSRERIVDPKKKTGDVRRQYANSERDANTENFYKRERVADPKMKTSVGQRRQTNSEDRTQCERFVSRDRTAEPKQKPGGGRRRHTCVERGTRVDSLGAKERVVDHKVEMNDERRRQNNSEQGTFAAALSSRECVVDCKEKDGPGHKRQDSSEHAARAEKWGRRGRGFDTEMNRGDGRRKQTNSEHGRNAEKLTSGDRVVDPREKADGGQGRQVGSDHGRNAAIRGSRERDADAKMKAGFGQRRPPNSEHRTHVEKLNNRGRVVENNRDRVVENNRDRVVENNRDRVVENNRGRVVENNRDRVVENNRDRVVENNRGRVVENNRDRVVENNRGRVVDPQKKAGDARGRQTNMDCRTVTADIEGSQRVVERNGVQRQHTHSGHGAQAEVVCPKERLVDSRKEMPRNWECGSNVARHEMGQSQRVTQWPTEPEDEDDWNMDHYGLSDMSLLTAALPVTIEAPPVSGADDTVVSCRDEDTGERSHVTICDIDTETSVISHETPLKCHRNDSDVMSCHNTDVSVCTHVVTDVYVSDRRSDDATPVTVDGRHRATNDDLVTFRHCHTEDTVTPHDVTLTASDSYTQVVDAGSSFYLSAAGHSYRRPCVRRASPVTQPLWGHRRSSYDYLPVMSLSPPADTEEDVTSAKGFKRHKTGNQESQTGNVNHSPPDILPCPSYPGCAPCLPVCTPRPRYSTPPLPGPPQQWFLQGGGPGSLQPPTDLMFFDNSGQMWSSPPGYQPGEDWYRQNHPQGWYAPVPFPMDTPRLVNNAAPPSTVPIPSPTANPLVQDLQLLASCLVPPPPPPPPLLEETPDNRQSEEKPTSECYSTWPKTQPTAASYVARPPCQTFHYGVPSMHYKAPSSSCGTSDSGAQNNVKTTKPSPHQGDDTRNIQLQSRESLAAISEVGSGVASSATSKPTPPITSHEFADAVFSNYAWMNDGNQKKSADQEPSAKSPTSQNDARVVVSRYNGDDSLTDDSLMNHCADMSISMATTGENYLQGTAEPRGKVKFRVAHYVPPTMRMSSSFSIVSSVESVSRTARSPKDANTTLPSMEFSGGTDNSLGVNEPDGCHQQSPDKMRAISRCSPYGPWQTTSTPVTQPEPSSRTPDGASEFTFQTPRRRSAPGVQMRRRLMNVDPTGVTSPKAFTKSNSVTSMTGAAVNNSVPCTSVSSSVDSDLNLCGMGSSVESSPCTSQRISRFSCCSVSSNNSQETWSELSVSFDDVPKVDVPDPEKCAKKEDGEIDWFDGECRPSAEKSRNRYEMFPEKRDTSSGSAVYTGSGLYGGSYSGELQANYTNPARNKWNLPPRMQRLLQESASASRAQCLLSKIQQPASTYTETHGGRNNSWQSFDWRSKLKEIFERSSERFLDSHCHLDFLFDRINFKGTFKKYVAVNEDTFCDNFAGCVTVFCHPHTFTTEGGLWTDVLREDNVWGAVGCHPKCATNFNARAERAMKVMLKHDKMVAVGEIGLDYSGTFYQHHDVQKEVLARQLKLATEINKPIVIHSRESEADIITELEKHIPRNHKIHRHCFTGTWEEARTWLHKFPNSYIGLTALLTHRSRRAFPLKDVARYLPLDKLLIETDTPYFVPWRIPKTDMEFCHPGMVITVADEVARLKGIHIDVVLKASYENTLDMYGI